MDLDELKRDPHSNRGHPQTRALISSDIDFRTVLLVPAGLGPFFTIVSSSPLQEATTGCGDAF